MKIYDIDFDSVIDGVVANGSITYKDAIDKLVPLISKTEFQRKLQDRKFYEKLERDIEKGCIMPPITIAYVNKQIMKDSSEKDVIDFFNEHHRTSFVLDGIQRLNTLNRVAELKKIDFKKKTISKYYFL